MSVVFLALSYLLSKVGAISNPTRSKAIEIINAAQTAGHKVRFIWGMGPSEHATGNALDIMVYDAAAGDFIRDYVWANRARLRLRHVIWEQHITSTVVQPGVRRLMDDRGNSTQNHYDHNHILFLDAAMYIEPHSAVVPPARPKVDPKKKTAPTKVSIRMMAQPMAGADVLSLQRNLRRVFPAYAGQLFLDGKFGPATDKAVREFQRRAGIGIDGKVGPNTRAALRRFGARL